MENTVLPEHASYYFLEFCNLSQFQGKSPEMDKKPCAITLPQHAQPTLSSTAVFPTEYFTILKASLSVDQRF